MVIVFDLILGLNRDATIRWSKRGASTWDEQLGSTLAEAPATLRLTKKDEKGLSQPTTR